MTIDITELMDDPDFLAADPVTLVVRSNPVNQYGEGVMQETSALIQAIIQPGAGDMFDALPDASRLKESIRIWTRATLQVQQPGGDGYSDVILYRGQRWEVQYRMDYSMWGAGWTKAVATFDGTAKQAPVVVGAYWDGGVTWDGGVLWAPA